MTMDRAYVNYDEGSVVCCWNAPGQKEIAALFASAGATYDRIMPAEEMAGASGGCCASA